MSNIKKEEAIAELKKIAQRVEKSLSNVTVEDLEKTAPSYNAKFDGKPLSFLIDHLNRSTCRGALRSISSSFTKSCMSTRR